MLLHCPHEYQYQRHSPTQYYRRERLVRNSNRTSKIAEIREETFDDFIMINPQSLSRQHHFSPQVKSRSHHPPPHQAQQFEKLILPSQLQFQFIQHPPSTTSCPASPHFQRSAQSLDLTRAPSLKVPGPKEMGHKKLQNYLSTDHQKITPNSTPRSTSARSPASHRRKLPQVPASARKSVVPNNVNQLNGNHLLSPKGPQRTQSARYKRRPSNLSRTPTVTSPEHGFRSRTGSEGRNLLARDEWAHPSQNPFEARFLNLPESEHYERIRMFSIDKGNVINRGDSFRRRSGTSSSNGGNSASPHSNSVLSSRSPSPLPISTVEEPHSTYNSNSEYSVMILGEEGTGKSSIINQFLTTEYSNPFTEDIENGETGVKRVSVVIEGGETHVNFSEKNIDQRNDWQQFFADGYVIVFSVDSRKSYEGARMALNFLQSNEKTGDKPIILVCNKVDLARKVAVSREEASALAKQHQCSFLELSLILHLNVDELLVGIVTKMKQYNNQKLNRRCRSAREVRKDPRGSIKKTLLSHAGSYSSITDSGFSGSSGLYSCGSSLVKGKSLMKHCFGLGKTDSKSEDLTVFKMYKN